MIAMLNRDIYSKPPQQRTLVNNGVAEVSEERSEAADSVLRYELETFVCDGQYAQGLQKVLDTFLRNLGSGTEQPGVWISGFYGSGKSHLAKMLRALWTDHRFADGATARGIARLPDGVSDALKELSTQGRREGGLHAAAGKLGAGAGDNVRLALLAIVFRSRGLPEQYNQAQFVLWLEREGLRDAVAAELAAAGRSLAGELPHLYVSGPLARALLAARPGFADTEAGARQLVKAQFPQAADISNEQLVAAITAALSAAGTFPLSLIVLDEVQQYIGNDADKAYKVQEVTESLCKHFRGRLLFVGTGQSALTGTPSLQRIRGRFPVEVMLGDWDVENVTRQIILAKKSSAAPAVEQVWRSNLGEISRHLRGTKLEHVADDEAWLTADYPLLPVRRRFWERVLRSIDTTGTVSQLRSQLRVVHEAVLGTADDPLGHVVPADFLYDQIAASLVSTAQLPKEVYENIGRFRAGPGNAPLKARLLKLVYLINKLPPEAAIDTGLKATEDALADLLVTDLAAGSADLRRRLPALLGELQDADRLVMALTGSGGTEYRLQTRESSAWYDEFRAQEAELKAAPQRVETQRADLLKERFRRTLAKVRVTQGKSAVPRDVVPVFDDALPKDHDRRIYLWIQDGWQTDEKSVRAEARAKGADNPTVFGFLSAQHKTDISNAIVALEAARATLRRKGTPATEEGRDAQRSMESRQRNAEKELDDLLDRLFAGVIVLHAGGQEVTDGKDLAERLVAAARVSTVRLYREFDTADDNRWAKVLDEARKGSAEALKAVDHAQEADKHAVCAKLLAFVGPGKKGGEIRDRFEEAPFGWPRDAIDGALYALLASGRLLATDAAGKPIDARSLDRAKLTQAAFRQESVTVTPVQKIKLRTLFDAAGIKCPPQEELNKAPLFLARLRELAGRAGGPPPAPAVPDLSAIADLEALSGNALLHGLFVRLDDLTACIAEWQRTAEEIARRLPTWHRLAALLEHTRDLGPHAELKAETDAILAQRSLLVDPDPVRPVLERTVALLRQALNAKLDGYARAHAKEQAALEADADWNRLAPAQRDELTARHHLRPEPLPERATPEQLQDALDDCDLAHWLSKTQALPSRFGAARHAAARLLKPDVVHVPLPRRTLSDAAELAEWLAEVERLISAQLKIGPVSL